MKRRDKVATLRILNSNTTDVDGVGVFDAIKRLGIPYMRSRFGGGWSIPGRHTDDVCAYLETRGYRIEATL